MALPTMNATLAKKKRPSLDELADERMSLAPKASSATAVNEVAKPMADAARQGMAGVSKLGAPSKGPATSARPADPLDDLARERMAAEAEIDASNARQQMDQRSRAGLGGLGLSGAASAAAGDLGRQQARTKALTMADFDKMAEDRAFTDVQREAAIDDLETSTDVDYNDDGMIGGEKVGGKIGDGDVENDPTKKPADEEDAKRAINEAKALLRSDDLFIGDDDNGPGSKEQPYTFSSMKDFVKWFRETTGSDPVLSSESYGGTFVMQDQFGNWYTLTDQPQR
jgi:hypothetical protein